MKYKRLIASVLIILELLLCAGIVLVSWAGASQMRATNVRWRVLQFDTVSAEASEEQRFAVGDAATLVVENSRGRVAVASSPGNEIIVAAHKTAWGSSPSDAQAVLASLRVNIAQNANTIRVQVVEPSVVVLFGSTRSNTVDFTIMAPITTAVTLRTDYGDMTLSGTAGDADLRTNRGAVHATNVSGRLKLYSDYGEITLERATTSDVEANSNRGAVSLTDVKAEGAVSLSSDYGDIRFKNGSADSLMARTNRGAVTLTDLTARGSVAASSDYGEITLERAATGNVEAHSNRGAVSLADVKAEGAVNLSDDYGAIRFKDGRADSLTVKTNRGEVTLTSLTIRGAVIARNDYGAVTVDQVQAASYDLYTNRGDVSVDGASGTLKAQTDSGNVDVKNADKVNLDLRTNRGSIVFAGSLGDGPHTLQTDSGNLRLRLPPSTALTFELKTDRGQIKSDFPVTITGDVGQTHWRGTINGGGARLTAGTGNGDILLNILNP